MQVSYSFEAQKRVGSDNITLLNGELLVTEVGRGRTDFLFDSVCHGDGVDGTESLTRPVTLRGREFELEAHSPAGAEHPYTVTVHAAAGDPSNTVEVWVTPAGGAEMMLRFFLAWGFVRTVYFETRGLWKVVTTIEPETDTGG